ncbi:heavy-metal-associated domain-containing protein [Amnibacterium kyonggiense]|uniref:Copper chaperone CopZ n=1 Tax=Amnibacterium kyonggiense TaxID=595671 RepID=A0A4R7FS89_9MICO|nr:heavy-metal-associated domain-containing protein [Amnibacterium kyonggiense]TDS80717.1 copper chaperone CopZ [Amnibacterium kyonggiense]
MQDLGITDISAAGGGCACGGAGCGGAGHHAAGHGDHHAEHGHHAADRGGQSFEVAGMTCEHCVMSVTEELSALDGVEAVSVDLRPGAASTVVVTATRALTGAEVEAAVEDAGYTLAR